MTLSGSDMSTLNVIHRIKKTFITAVQHERAPRCHQFRMQGPDISRFSDERPSPYPVGDLLDRTR